MVTGAPRLPHTGSLLEMGTGDSLSSQAPPAVVAVSAVISPVRNRCWSYPHMTATPARKQRKKPTMATPVFTPPASASDDGTPGEWLLGSLVMTHLSSSKRPW